MKKLTTLAVLLLLCVVGLFAQAPDKFTYQAVVRFANNSLAANTQIGVRISILQGSVVGEAVFVETHIVNSNANGLITLEIGSGNVQVGSISNIDWSNGLYFLRTETDPYGGIDYIVTSTQQLMSVPYALYAKEAGNGFSGDYNDLTNTPVIPIVPSDVSAFNNDAGYLTSFTEQQVLSISNDTVFLTGGSFVKLPAGFDGDYNSLINKPVIPTTVGELTNNANYITIEEVPAQVNADWNATEGAAQILNKPELFDGDYNSLTNKPELFSGDYNDLTNTPTIPTVPTNVGAFTNDANYVTTTQLNDANYITAADVPAQVNADWNATEGAAQILNKPELFDGDYNSLTNTPSIPTTVSELTNDANYITINDVPEIPTVPTNVSAFNNDAGYITNADIPEIPTVPTSVSVFTNDANYISNTGSCINSVNLCDMLERLEMLENQLQPIMIMTEGVTAITQTSFTVMGKVLTDGVNAITQRGFVYGIDHNPTLNNNIVSNGSGNGSFTSTITGLNAAYTYYVRAFAVNNNGTFYGNEMAVTTTAPSPSTLPSVTTIAVTNITVNEATVRGAVTSDGGEPITHRGFVYDTLPNPTLDALVAYHGTGVGEYVNLLTYLYPSKTYYFRAFAQNSVGVAYGNELSFTTNAPAPVAGDAIPCPSTPTVTDHEGNIYNTVQIGTQCWTKENLRTTTSPSTGTYLIPPAGTALTYTGKQAWWYDNDSATYAPRNCGLLYNYNAAMDTFNTAFGETSLSSVYEEGINYDFSEPRRGICPQGWHVPSHAEWVQLYDYLNSHEEYRSGNVSGNVTKALASTNYWAEHEQTYSPGNIPSENNLSGFSAIPAGCSGISHHTTAYGLNASFWSTTPWWDLRMWHFTLIYYDVDVWQDGAYKNGGLSVRCLKD